MKKILKTAAIVLLVYAIALGAAFVMSARVERLDSVETTKSVSLSLH